MEDESVGDWDDLLRSYAVDAAAAVDHPSLAADDVQPSASANAADADYDSWDSMFLPAVPQAQPRHAAQMEAAETDRVAVPANRLYGNPSSLRHIGTRLHQSLFSWFRLCSGSWTSRPRAWIESMKHRRPAKLWFQLRRARHLWRL